MANRQGIRIGGWVAAAAAACGLLWLLRNTWPVQMLFLFFGMMTGIDIQNLWDPPVRWHTKQTLTIETPQGDVTSSVVREKVMGAGRLVKTAWSREKGEALTIEIAPGRYLFVLIEEFKPYEERLFFPDTGWDLYSAQKLHTVIGKSLEVPPDKYPMMVTFGDLKEPKSVQEVKPSDLSATFGPGYRIKSYTVEITDEPVTTGHVAEALPWILTIKGAFVPSPLKDADKYTLSELMSIDDFIVGATDDRKK